MLKLLVIGHLGKDAITNTTTNGNSVINFSVAHTEKFTDNQGVKKEKTTWVDCSWWTDKHAIVPYLKKGIQVYVEGQPEIKTFSKQDGSTGTSLSLRVGMCQLLSSNNSSQQPAQSAPTTQTMTSVQLDAQPPLADDLPF